MANQDKRGWRDPTSGRARPSRVRTAAACCSGAGHHLSPRTFIAISYNAEVRTVSYTATALRDLKRHGNVAGRLRKAVAEYAADPQAHANNVTQLVGSPFQRIRVGDFRAIFEATDTALIVVKVAPRSEAYE